MRCAVLVGMLFVLTGCVTDQDVAYLAANYPTRSEVSAVNAEAACKALARNLVQIARCEPRRY